MTDDDRLRGQHEPPARDDDRLRRQLERSPSQVAFNTLPLRLNEPVPMYVAHVDSPGSFWCQLSSGAEQLEQLMTQLQTTYEQLQPSDKSMLNAIVNRVCCAKYSDDGRWHRAKVG